MRGHHHFGPPKTRAGRRSVPLPRIAANALEEHLAVAHGQQLVFTAPEGGPLRPSLFWIAAGASPKEIAARAGHASVVTVLDRYGHLLPGSEDRVNDALDAMADASRVTLVSRAK